MTTVSNEVNDQNLQSTSKNLTEIPETSFKFELMVALTAFWLIFGVHIDGWAHNNLPSSLESFFTPWHGILYTGFGALATVLLFELASNYGKGYSLTKAMPEGYTISVLGIIIFGLGGFLDGVWHTLLGIEETVDALYSPTHLMLAIGAAFMFTGPMRYAWNNTTEWNDRTFKQKIPTIMTFSFFISILMFFHQYAVPLHSVFPALPFGDVSNPSVAFYNEAAGMAGIILFSIIIATMLLKINTKLDLPFGSHLIIFFSITLFGTMMRFPIGSDADPMNQLARILFVSLGLVIGLVVDIVNTFNLSNETHSWFYTVVVPFLFFTGYVTIITITLSSVYTVHLVLGIPFVAALVGYLVKLSHIN